MHHPEYNIVDILTKPLRNENHSYFTNMLL